MTDFIMQFLQTLMDLYLDTAIWLLLGLALAALLKGVLPTRLVQRWLGGTGAGPVFRGALIGAPLPLCSCGVLPAAIGLHRAGASRPATTSFLIATPETGVDSIAVSYALLGPIMAIIRPIAAIFSAIATGLLVLVSGDTNTGNASSVQTSSGCSKTANAGNATDCCASKNKESEPEGFYPALLDLLDDIKYWLLFGLVLAALVGSFVDPAALSEQGDSLWVMLLILLLSLPLYICATASTPIAAIMLWAGLSPGAVLLFMLVGPATNIASVGLLIRELGVRTVVLYLFGIIATALTLALTTNAFLTTDMLSLPPLGEHSETALWIKALAGVVLAVLIIKPLRQLFYKEPTSDSCCGS